MCSVLATRKTAEKVRKVPLAVNLLAVKSAVYTTKNTRDKTPVRILTVNKITPCTHMTLGNQFDNQEQTAKYRPTQTYTCSLYGYF